MVVCFKIMRIEKYLFFNEVEKYGLFYSYPLEKV
jgi:hypothetical protein